MIYEIKVKKTGELTQEEWVIYVAAFNEIFHGDLNQSDFEKKYFDNPSGYALHSLLFCDGVLVGSQSFMFVPLLYRGERMMFACACDTFIRKKYRKRFDSLKNMYEAAIPVLSSLGIVAVIGEPKKEVYDYLSDMGIGQKIGNINTYVLPINPFFSSNILSKVCNMITRFSMRVLLLLARLSTRKLFRGDELFRPAEYYTPSAYYSDEVAIGNDLKLNYFISHKKHIVIVYDNFESVANFLTGVSVLLKKYAYQVRAVEYRTVCRLPFPFICYNRGGFFFGFILGNNVSKKDFFELLNWQYKRGYFD